MSTSRKNNIIMIQIFNILEIYNCNIVLNNNLEHILYYFYYTFIYIDT